MKQFTNAVKANAVPDGYDASFTASTPTKDRHNSVVPQNHWILDNYNANPIIGYNHFVWGDDELGPNPDAVIGKGRSYINGEGNLQLDVKFDDVSDNKIAEKVKAKIEGGFLNSVSVGFMENTPGRYVNKQGKEVSPREADHYEYGEVELMEVSVVNLPANPQALVMSKAAEIDELKSQLKSLENLKKKVKDVGEEMKTVGETLSIWEQNHTAGKEEIEVEFVDDDFEKLELEKLEQEQLIRKRKARTRARRINL